MNNNKRPVVLDAVFDFFNVSTAHTVDTHQEREILTGVVMKRCPVISYNPYSNMLVYERDGRLVYTNAIEYHGEGYVEVE